MQVGWTRGTGGLSTEARGHAAMSAEISQVGRLTGVNLRIRRIFVEIWLIHNLLYVYGVVYEVT